MRTILPRKIPKRSVTSPIAVPAADRRDPAWAPPATMTRDYSRREYIEWSDTPEFDRKPDILHFFRQRFAGERLQCNLRQDERTLHRDRGIRRGRRQRGEAAAPAWLELVKIEHDYLPGTLACLQGSPASGTYKERKLHLAAHRGRIPERFHSDRTGIPAPSSKAISTG